MMRIGGDNMKYPIRILMCVLAAALMCAYATPAEASRTVNAECGAKYDTRCTSEDCRRVGNEYENVKVAVMDDLICEKGVPPILLINDSTEYTMTLAGEGNLIRGSGADKCVELFGIGPFTVVDTVMEGCSTGLYAPGIKSSTVIRNVILGQKVAINADHASYSTFHTNVLAIEDLDFYAVQCDGCKGVEFYNNRLPNFLTDCKIAGGVQFSLEKPLERLNIVGGSFWGGNYWEDDCAAVDPMGFCKPKVVTDCGDVDRLPLAMMEAEPPIVAISQDVYNELVELVPDAKAIVKKAESISILAKEIVELEEEGKLIKVLSGSAKAAGNAQALDNTTKEMVPPDLSDKIKEMRVEFLKKKWDAMETLKAK